MQTIDARGLSCPQPVLMTKNALTSHSSSLEILVDNETAKENVLRFLENENYQVQVLSKEEVFHLKAQK